MESLPKEVRLLVLAARLELQEEHLRAISSLLDEGIDWRILLDQSRRLGMLPLLHRHLSSPRLSPRLPAEVLQSLRSGYELTALQNIRLQACIDRMVEAMRESSLPIALLKGAFLSRVVYPDMALRPMGDIDILCRLEERAAVQERLRALGFSPRDLLGVPLDEEEGTPWASHLPALFRMDLCRVELHWKLFRRRAPSPEEIQAMWAEVEVYEADGMPLPGLSPDCLLLYLCTHLHQHGLKGGATLYWFCDLHETLLAFGRRIDWKRFMEKAESLGEDSSVRAVLHLLRRYWGSPVPDLPAGCETLSLAEVLGVTMGAHVGRAARRQSLPDFGAQLRSVGRAGGWWSQVRFLVRFIFPPRAYMREVYPRAGRLWLRYAWRPLLIAWRAAHSLLLNLVERERGA